MDDLLHFKKFLSDADEQLVESCFKAAIDKLQTLYPGKKITTYGQTVIGIESDSLYADNGQEIYYLGVVDDELPALLRQSDNNLITFRV